MNSNASEPCRQSSDILRTVELPPDLPPDARRPRRWWPMLAPELAADARLTALTRLVCVELTVRGRWLHHGDGDLLAVVPCAEKIAADLGKDPSSIRRVIRRLKVTRRGDGWAYLTEVLRDDGRVMWYLALPYPANPRKRPEYLPAAARPGAAEEARSPEGSLPAYTRGEEARQDRQRPPRRSPLRGAVEPGSPKAPPASRAPAPVAPSPASCSRDPAAAIPGLCCERHCRQLEKCSAGQAHVAELRERERKAEAAQQAARQEARQQVQQAARALVPKGPSKVDTLALVSRAAVHCLPVLTLAAPGEDAGLQQANHGLQVPEKSCRPGGAPPGGVDASQQDEPGDPLGLLDAEQQADPLRAQLTRCRAVLAEVHAQHGPPPVLPIGQAGPLPSPPPTPTRGPSKGPRGLR